MQHQNDATEVQTKSHYEAFESHIRRLELSGYILQKDSATMIPGISQDPLTPSNSASAHSVSVPQFNSDRRLRCQRVSNYWQHLALSLSLLPVRANRKLENQHQFRLNQRRPANTNNISTGRAFSPAPTTLLNDCQMAGWASSC